MNQALISVPKPKDFLETKEGLIFAVVAHGEEKGRALTFLRYVKSVSNGKWQKFNTNQANSYLQRHHPFYLYHSDVFDADLHGVSFDKVIKHHHPSRKLSELMSLQPGNDSLQVKLTQLVDLLNESGIPLESLGITGSFLIGAENEKSDIDLVIYERSIFHRAREVVRDLIDRGKLSALDKNFWKDSYDRRACSLTLEEYVWHEKRKYNKAVFQDIKFDLSLVVDTSESVHKIYKKKGRVTISAEVINDQYAFDTPCTYLINHPEFKKVICFTPTYTGQAISGNRVEIAGFIEESEDGKDRRIIIGSSREAPGEYIKVIG